MKLVINGMSRLSYRSIYSIRRTAKWTMKSCDNSSGWSTNNYTQSISCTARTPAGFLQDVQSVGLNPEATLLFQLPCYRPICLVPTCATPSAVANLWAKISNLKILLILILIALVLRRTIFLQAKCSTCLWGIRNQIMIRGIAFQNFITLWSGLNSSHSALVNWRMPDGIRGFIGKSPTLSLHGVLRLPTCKPWRSLALSPQQYFLPMSPNGLQY